MKPTFIAGCIIASCVLSSCAATPEPVKPVGVYHDAFGYTSMNDCVAHKGLPACEQAETMRDMQDFMVEHSWD
jgi:hypothetical protein